MPVSIRKNLHTAEVFLERSLSYLDDKADVTENYATYIGGSEFVRLCLLGSFESTLVVVNEDFDVPGIPSKMALNISDNPCAIDLFEMDSRYLDLRPVVLVSRFLDLADFDRNGSSIDHVFDLRAAQANSGA